MQTHTDFSPYILFPDDLYKVAVARRRAMAQAGCADLDPHDVAGIALHICRMQLVGDGKLADATGQVVRCLVGSVRTSTRPF